MLIEEWKEPCTLLEKRRDPDGEGGFLVHWVDGTTFDAAINFLSSTQAKIAEAQGVTSLYEVFAPKDIKLDYHDVFRRESDGQIFRITTHAGDVETPTSATFSFAKSSAERWALTND